MAANSRSRPRVTGTVSLDADRKGINMSRIMRTFYDHADEAIRFGVIERALDAYKDDHDTLDARIQMRLSYPMRVESLRSGLAGWQYYDIALELVETGGVRRRIVHLDYVYSSTCPCSLELSEHARRERGQLATPHSQRSVARISVALDRAGGTLWFEDLVELCRAARADRDPGDGQARGRAGLRRAQRGQPGLRGGCGAPLCRASASPIRASATSVWRRATRKACTATTRCRS